MSKQTLNPVTINQKNERKLINSSSMKATLAYLPNFNAGLMLTLQKA